MTENKKSERKTIKTFFFLFILIGLFGFGNYVFACISNEDCQSPYVCVSETGMCGCYSNSDCPVGHPCLDYQYQCGCGTDDECMASCIANNGVDYCTVTGNRPRTYCETGVCVETYPVCDGTTGKCVFWDRNTVNVPGLCEEYLIGTTCVSDPCANPEDCPETECSTHYVLTGAGCNPYAPNTNECECVLSDTPGTDQCNPDLIFSDDPENPYPIVKNDNNKNNNSNSAVVDNFVEKKWYSPIAVALGYYNVVNAETGEVEFTSENDLPYGGLVALVYYSLPEDMVSVCRKIEKRTCNDCGPATETIDNYICDGGNIMDKLVEKKCVSSDEAGLIGTCKPAISSNEVCGVGVCQDVCQGADPYSVPKQQGRCSVSSQTCMADGDCLKGLCNDDNVCSYCPTGCSAPALGDPKDCSGECYCPPYCEEKTTYTAGDSCAAPVKVNNPPETRCSGCNVQEKWTTPACGPSELFPDIMGCFLTNYFWKTSKDCGCCQPGDYVCEGSDIVLTSSGSTCGVTGSGAQCVPAVCASRVVTNCGTAQNAMGSFCSNGVSCTLTISYSGKCFSVGGTQVPKACAGGQVATCGSSGTGGTNGTPSCIPSGDPTSPATNITCTVGARAGGCEAPDVNIVCEGECDGGDDPNPRNPRRPRPPNDPPDPPECLLDDPPGYCVFNHNECNSSLQCVLVDGLGDDACYHDTDCQNNSSHTECNVGTEEIIDGVPTMVRECILLATPGLSQCGSSDDCNSLEKPHFNICSNGRCLVKSGAGKNQCTLNSQCDTKCNKEHQCVLGGTGASCLLSGQCVYFSHNECNDCVCEVVNSAGIDLCGADTGMECCVTKCNDQKQCVPDGDGPVCSSSIDCLTYDPPNNNDYYHTECDEMEACVPVLGLKGQANQCSGSADCQVRCNKEHQCVKGGQGGRCLYDWQCQFFTHNECIDGQCTIIDSMGDDLCGGDSGLNCEPLSRCNLDKQCVPDGTGAECLLDSDCVIKKCDTVAKQCSETGTGAICSADSDCVTRCNEDKQCVLGGEGAECSTASDCIVKKCDTTTWRCSETGSGSVCSVDSDCAPKCNDDNWCVVGGTGDACLTDFDCGTPIYRCDTDKECGHGDGPICNSSEECTIGMHNVCGVKWEWNAMLVKFVLVEACVTIEGEGIDECTNADQCSSHTECNIDKQCEVVVGDLEDSCTDDTNCSFGHTECNDLNQCVFVETPGFDLCGADTGLTCEPIKTYCTNMGTCTEWGDGVECAEDADCIATMCNDSCQCSEYGSGAFCSASSECPLYGEHNECVNQKCELVTNDLPCIGSTNECSMDIDCQPRCNPGNNNKCEVGGSGAICSIDADCQPKCSVFHNECQNWACVLVSGPGKDQCVSNSDCVPGCTGYAKCGISDRSGAYCASSSDCMFFRSVCSNGVCILTDGNVSGSADECDTNEDCAPEPPACETNWGSCNGNQCVYGGAGTGCSENLDCVSRCNENFECVVGGVGAQCSSADDCAIAYDPEASCFLQSSGLPIDSRCVLCSEVAKINLVIDSLEDLGGGDNEMFNSYMTGFKAVRCDNIDDPGSTPEGVPDAKMSHYQCVVGGDGPTCSTDTECSPKCNADGQCVSGGTGEYCSSAEDCQSTRCNDCGQCVKGGTGKDCSSGDDCLPRCDESCQCSQNGTGTLCDPGLPLPCCAVNHNVCNDQCQCEALPGEGIDECGADTELVCDTAPCCVPSLPPACETSACIDGLQTITCTDDCGTTTETQCCTIWTIPFGDPSECVGGWRTQNYIDNCGMPADPRQECCKACSDGTVMTCVEECPPCTGTQTCCDGSEIPCDQTCPNTKSCPDGSVIPCDQECPCEPIVPPVCIPTEPCFCWTQNVLCDNDCPPSPWSDSQVCPYEPTQKICGDWSACVDGIKTRSCNDECGRPLPDETECCLECCKPCPDGSVIPCDQECPCTQTCCDGSEIPCDQECPCCPVVPPVCTPTEPCFCWTQGVLCDNGCPPSPWSDSQVCPYTPTEVCGEWSEWSEWSFCIDGAETKSRTRSRLCQDECGSFIPPQVETETEPCPCDNCEPFCTDWSDCNDCLQSRTCTDACCNTTTETQKCSMGLCNYFVDDCYCYFQNMYCQDTCFLGVISFVDRVSCEYTPDPLLTVCGEWGECDENNQRTRECTDECGEITTETDICICIDDPICYTDPCYCWSQNEICVETCPPFGEISRTPQTCEYTPTWTDWSEWSECNENNQQFRTRTNECLQEEIDGPKCCPVICDPDDCDDSCDENGEQNCTCIDGCGITWTEKRPNTKICPDDSVIPCNEECPPCIGTQICCDGSEIPCAQECPNTKSCPDGSVIPCDQECPCDPIVPPVCTPTEPCFCWTQNVLCDNDCPPSPWSESQTCPYVPTEKICGEWSACVDGVKTRSCTDECGTLLPDETECCKVCADNSVVGCSEECLMHNECSDDCQCTLIPLIGEDQCQSDTNNNTCCDHNICNEETGKCERIQGPGISLCENVGENCCDGPCSETHYECDIEKNCVELSGPGDQDCPVDCTSLNYVHNECNCNKQCVVVDSEGTDTCSNNSDCISTHTECNYFDQCVVINEPGDSECCSDLECTHTVCELSGESCQCVQKSGLGINECSSDSECISSSTCAKKNICSENQCSPTDCQEDQPCEDNCSSQENCCPQGSHTECEVGKCICKEGIAPNQCQIDQNCSHYSTCIFQKCLTLDCKPGNLCVDGCNIDNGDDDCEVNNPPTATDFSIDKGNYCTGIPSVGVVQFSWVYRDIEKDRERSFRLQVDDDSDFSSPEVDRVFDGLAVDSGSSNQQSIFVKTQPTIPYGDYIRYGIPYYWRVIVQQYKDDLRSDWIYYDGAKGTTDEKLKESYIYEYSHPAPLVDYTVLPELPVIGESASFIDNSICYNQSGPYACKGLPSGYSWTFGDDSSSSKVGDTSHSYNAQGTFTTSLQICDEIECCSATKNVPIKNESGTELPKYKEIPPY